MARLLTIVNERKKLRGEFRSSLEDNYIAEQKKKEEFEQIKARKEEKKALKE